MKLAWHIIRKDLVRLRWVLVLWVVVLIAGLSLATIQGGLDYENYFPFYLAAKVVLSGFLPLMTFGLVMGLLHDDSVAEVDAFWITRPISGGALLAAKALGLLLLGLIPVLCQLPFWLSHDYGWDQIARATQQTFRTHFLFAILALPFAVISANGSKFVMNVILGVAGLALLALLGGLGTSSAKGTAIPALIESKAWIVVGLWLTATLLVVLNQFLRWRTSWSLALLVLATTAGFVVAEWWPLKFDFVANRSEESAAVAPPFVAANTATFLAKIAGAKIPTFILAEVPLRESAASSLRGQTLKIQSISFDFTGQLEVSFSEATPQLFKSFRDLLPGVSGRSSAPEYYFVLNHQDGRAFAVKPVRHGSELEAATLRFSHSTISVRPATAWQSSAAPDLSAWLKGAALIKVAPCDSAPIVFPATTAVQSSR